MVFSSILFLFTYFPVVLSIYYIVPAKWRNLWLFAANLVFYGWGEPVYILLMILSITINYMSGILIDKHRENKQIAKRVLIFNTVINLSLLAYFKYFDLIAETLSLLPFLDIATKGLSLPIGISFYTFQTMSYPIDVYRGDASVQKNFISFGTFVALFPQLIAGPIVRYKDIADQLNFRSNDIEQFASGVRRFVIGLAKKVLIANNVGMLWDIYTAANAELTVFGSWLAIIAFTLQIYYDFSGYSDMAIGLGRMLGFEFLENFNYPYVSRSITEFWRRWHISLGSWFRDYVYIPLGGNRCGKLKQYRNIFIVWGLTGIWHGASWNFLMWGLYFGVLLMIEKSFLLEKIEKLPNVVGHFYTLFLVIISWVIFQLTSVADIVMFIKTMFGFGEFGLYIASDFYFFSSYALILGLGIVFSTPIPKNLYNKLSPKLTSVLTPILIALVLIVSTAYLVDATYNPFLYFRF